MPDNLERFSRSLSPSSAPTSPPSGLRSSSGPSATSRSARVTFWSRSWPLCSFYSSICPGLLLYTILRPPETLAEAYARSLEEESLIQEIEERQACPTCRHRVQPDFVLCPNCGEQLKQICPDCHRVLDLSWSRCPYCGSAESQGRGAGTDTGALAPGGRAEDRRGDGTSPAGRGPLAIVGHGPASPEVAEGPNPANTDSRGQSPDRA